jgi:spore coat protein H
MKFPFPHLIGWMVLTLLLAGCKPSGEDPGAQAAQEPVSVPVPVPVPVPDPEPAQEAIELVTEIPEEAPSVGNSSPAPVAPGAPGTLAAGPRPAATGLPEYELRLDRSAWRRLGQNPYANDTCPAVFLGGGETFEGARVRYRGQWARSWPKKPLKIFLPKEKPFQGYGALNLNSAWHDPALLREPLAFHVYAACGVPAPRARMVRLKINGQFEGLYVDVEQPKRQFLERTGLKGAAVYKALGRSNRSDERDLGGAGVYASEYEKETRETEGFGELQTFCHALATASDAKDFFEKHVDIDRLINYLAAGVLVQNWDCFNKNHHLIHDRAGSGKWFPTPWDVDRTFGDHWSWSFEVVDLPVLLGTREQPGVTGWNRLADRFLREPEYRTRFLNRLESLIQTEFTPERLYPVIDRWAVEIAADVVTDRAKWRGAAANFNGSIVQVKRFIEQRRTHVRQEIASLRRGVAPSAQRPAKPIAPRRPAG